MFAHWIDLVMGRLMGVVVPGRLMMRLRRLFQKIEAALELGLQVLGCGIFCASTILKLLHYKEY